jgi:hypothetical protein
MKVVTFVLLAIFVLSCMQNNYIVDAGNIRGTPSNTEEDVSPTSNAKGISDFRPKPHSPEDVTEENIRNKPKDATLSAEPNDLDENETITHESKVKGNGKNNSTTNEDNQMSEADEIEARMKDTDMMRQFVRGHLDNVNNLIQSEHDRLSKDKEERKKREQEERKQALEAELHNSVKLHTYVNRLKKRRKQINKCLDIIHGGADKLYWDLRKRFARIPAGSVCLALKKTKFPHIPIVGFKEDLFRKYVGWEPPSDGSTIIYYDAVKTHLFRCMCEEADLTRLHTKSVVAASMKQPVDNIENMASKEANKIVKEMQEEERYTQKKQ